METNDFTITFYFFALNCKTDISNVRFNVGFYYLIGGMKDMTLGKVKRHFEIKF